MRSYAWLAVILLSSSFASLALAHSPTTFQCVVSNTIKGVDKKSVGTDTCSITGSFKPHHPEALAEASDTFNLDGSSSWDSNEFWNSQEFWTENQTWTSAKPAKIQVLCTQFKVPHTVALLTELQKGVTITAPLTGLSKTTGAVSLTIPGLSKKTSSGTFEAFFFVFTQGGFAREFIGECIVSESKKLASVATTDTANFDAQVSATDSLL